jgi:hypothetical protein
VRPGAVGPEPHTAEEIAVRDACCGDDRLPRREVFRREDPFDILDPLLLRLVDLASRDRPELRLEVAAQTAQGGSRQDGLPRAADADREVVIRPADRRGHGRRHVAVLDQLDPRAGGADFFDQVVMAWPVEDDGRDVPHSPAEGLGDRLDVLGHGTAKIDLPPRDRPHSHLPHVHVGKHLKGTGLPRGDH